MPIITIMPEGRKIEAEVGTNLLEAVSGGDLHIEAPCGGKAYCGKCKARLVSGTDGIACSVSPRIPQDEAADGWFLLCQATLLGDTEIHIPDKSRLSGQKILTEGQGRRTDSDPFIRKVYVSVPEADINEPKSDWARLLDSVRVSSGMDICEYTDVRVARKLPLMLRSGSGGVTALLGGGGGNPRLLGIEAGDTTNDIYGVAFDIGTTTVVGYLVHLGSGKEIAVSSRMNPQVVFGDDVISRINLTMEDPEGLGKLQDRIVSALEETVTELAETAGIRVSDVYDMVVAGNTSMGLFLAGIPPKHLGLYPYSAVVNGVMELLPEDVGYRAMNPCGRIRILPNVGSFVGADTVGVMLAVESDIVAKPTLIIDIGTNGEIVMARDGQIWTSSCAAGPAFEGGHLSCGMRATKGAIDRISLGEPCRISTIGDARAKGICGSGLIDTLAELLRFGIVDMTGRLTDPADLPVSTPDDVRRRLIKDDKGHRFVLAGAGDSETGEEVVINQKDIRELQLIKAAIYAGCRILMDISGTSQDALDSILLAGAFGNFIDRGNALFIGLIPEVAVDRVASIGNAAGAGAKIALRSYGEFLRAQAIAKKAKFIELANRSDFQDQYMDAMFFNNAVI